MQNSRVIRFSSFEADLRTRELRKHGLKLKLQDQPFQVLVMLLERPGELITREEIRTRLWPQDTFVDFDHSLNVAVRRLRDALNDNPDTPRFVETLPRRGYRFIAPVQTTLPDTPPLEAGGLSLTAAAYASREKPTETNEAATAAPEVLAADSNADSDPRPPRLTERRSRRGSTLMWLMAGVFALVVISVAVLVWERAVHQPAAAQIIQRQLTANPSEIPLQAAAISPDGKYLVYSDLKGMHLQLIKTGQTQTLLAPEQFVSSNVSWLPDGTGVLASSEQRGTSSIWLISVLGSSPRKLRENATAPASSPDGSLIAFLGDLSTGAAATGIWVMGVDGENAHRVLAAQPGEQLFRVRWSPDGHRLAYSASVPGLPGHRLSPQAYAGTEILESVSLNGGVPTPLFTKAGLQDFCWLPDARILFSVTQEEMFGADSNLWAIRVDSITGNPTGQSEQLTNWASFSFTDFSTTKDGKHLAFLKLTAQDDVYVGSLEGNGTRLKTPDRLTFNDRDDWPMGWTPDSGAAVFWSDRNGRWEAYKQRIGQETAEVLPAGPEPKWYAHFTPDGAWLLYMALPKQQGPGRSVPVKIMRAPSSGGPPEEVLTAVGMTDFRCARAVKTVCVFNESSGDQTVFTSFDPVKGKDREIFRETSGGLGLFDVAPDGSRLAISQFDLEGGRIRLVSIVNGTASDLVVKGWNQFLEVDWAPDGRGLYVGSKTAQGGAVLYVDLQGRARLLWQQQGNIITCGRPSPNGRFLAIASWTTNANAWMIENF